jgi:hypothetical protein
MGGHEVLVRLICRHRQNLPLTDDLGSGSILFSEMGERSESETLVNAWA